MHTSTPFPLVNSITSSFRFSEGKVIKSASILLALSKRSLLKSVSMTLAAPPLLAIMACIKPIDPAPIIKTSSPSFISTLSKVFNTQDSGSARDASSNVMESGIAITLPC